MIVTEKLKIRIKALSDALVANPRGTLPGLFSLLHLIAKDALDYFRIGALPAAKIVHRERVLDGCEFLVFLIQSVIGAGTEMKLNKSALGFFSEQIVHKRVDDRPISGRDIAIDTHCRMLAEEAQ